MDLYHDLGHAPSTAELHLLKLGYMSIDTCFRKIESIATILTSLGSLVTSEDVVTFSLEGSCRFGNDCKFVHDTNAKPANTNVSQMSSNNTDELLVKLLDRLGSTNTTNISTSAGPTNTPTVILTVYVAKPNAQTIAPLAQHTAQLGFTGSTVTSAQATTLPHYFTARTLHDPTTSDWNIDTGASSHLNNSITSLSEVFNSCIYLSVSVRVDHSIPVTNTGHSILPTPFRSFHLNNVLITPHIVKKIIYVLQFVYDNNCTIEFDAFGFSVKDFMTRRVLLRCDSTVDLYPVTAPSLIPHVFLYNQHTWHQRLGHPRSKVLRHLVFSNFISCNKEKPPVLCYACQLGKHVRLSFVNSDYLVTSWKTREASIC
uniref:Ribonuclease H-like domain-containing protein n=1 Tax=Tanacetum cinerariifolium TaxID=118510 RepID=A0A6L2N2X3_TANCI|nr:ribonuclease H-like domain-containing protein [Tanacetum cinerariifolium]